MTTPSSMEYRFVDGDRSAPPLLLLHGTGGGPDDLLDLGGKLGPDSAMLAPRGPVTEDGAARWFHRPAPGVFDPAEVVAGTERLTRFLADAAARHRLGEPVAVGFSNGANAAAALVLLHPELLRGAVLFAAMAPLPDPPSHDLTGTRVFISNGEHDPMAPLPSAHQLIADLRQRGAETTSHWHSGGHTITPDGVRAARAWFTTA